jgi:O-antigen/teichoic acid export membrane protein
MSEPTQASQQFNRDVRFSLFTKTLYLLTRVALPPLVLMHVSLADYGIWSIAFILISYLGLTATGFASVYVRLGAVAHRNADPLGMSHLISTGIACLGALSVVLMAGLWWALPWTLEWLNVAPAQRDTARTLVLGCSAVFLTDITLGAYAYLLHGVGRIRQEQTIWTAAHLTELGTVVLLLNMGFGIEALLIAFAVRYTLSISAAAWLMHKAIPELSLHPRHVNSTTLRLFLGEGLVVQGSALLANALHSVDRVLAGWFMGSSAAALFELGNKLPSAALSIPSAVSGVALPAAARSHHAAEVLALYVRSTRLTGLLTALPMPFLALFSLPLCQFWLGNHPSVHTIATLMTMLTVAGHLHILTGPGSSIFRGTGAVRNEYNYHGLRGVWLLATVGVAWWSQSLNPVGLAAALMVGGVGAALCYLMWNHRLLAGNFRGFGSTVLWPSLAGYPAAVAVGVLAHAGHLWPQGAAPRIELVTPLALSGMAYLALAAATLWLAVLHPHEKQRVIALFRPFFSPTLATKA